MKGFVCLGVMAALIGLQGQGLPVPRKLVEARTAYLANAGVELTVFEELHKQLRVWGRLTFADDARSRNRRGSSMRMRSST